MDPDVEKQKVLTFKKIYKKHNLRWAMSPNKILADKPHQQWCLSSPSIILIKKELKRALIK